ncbi:MAG: Rrf2 family transcriptional regulator, partial [Betaproteobacteria bacterium]
LYSVIEFAAHPDRHLSTAEIAARHGVSAHHLAKVLSELARAGIVESVRGVGSALLEAISAHFRAAGVTKLRTLLARDNTLILSFFRSQGMMAGPLIPLEMDLEPAR